jgi:hypothetical protein
MNIELLKVKMADFFENVSPEYLIEKYERMGYTFVDASVCWEPIDTWHVRSAGKQPVKPGWFKRNVLRQTTVSEINLTSEFPGSFFLLNLVS